MPSGVVTFLLTDIEGSTRLWERDPDAMERALLRHDTIIEDAVVAHRGRVVKSKGEGDATFSVFAAASDAALAALAAQDALNAEQWPTDVGLRVRMALHTGGAVERGGDYYGTTVNRAARLRALASGAQVFVSSNTSELVRSDLPPDVDLVALGALVLKDLSEPEEVFALAGRSLTTPALTATAGGGAVDLPLPAALRRADAGPFVGREAELDQLRAAADAARTGQTRFVMIGGEPGVGKTTLVSAFAADVPRDVLVLYGQCDENLGVAYHPFADALESYVRACPPDLLRRQAGVGARELTRMLPLIAEVLPDVGSPTESDAETERFRLFKAVGDLLDAISSARPVVLVLDDVHWATLPTLLMLRQMCKRTEMRLLVVATYRNTELDRSHPLSQALADFRREPGVERLVLRGLDPSAVHSYLVAAAGGAEVDRRASEFAHELWAETQGNPFFVREVVAHLVETGTIFEHDGTWQARADLDVADFGLPESVREVIARRLARLSDDTNKVLGVASAVGPSFSERLLKPVVGLDGDRVLDALESARDAGLLHEQGSHFEFAHALIRHALYEELSAARRARFHRRIAETLEELGPDGDEDRHVRALAHHYTQAAFDGTMDKALDYALAAGRNALERGALEEGASILESAVELATLATPVDLRRRLELNIALSDTYRRRAVVADIERTGEAAVADARMLGDPTAFGRAVVARFWASVGVAADRAVALIDEALDVVEVHAVRAMLLADYATALSGSYGRRDEALAKAREARALADRAGDPIAQCRAIECQLLLMLSTPDLAERRRLIAERAPLLARLARGYVSGTAWEDVAQLELAAGNFDEFERCMDQAEEVAIDWEPVTVALLVGDFAFAEEHLTEPIGDGPNYFNVWAAQLFQLHRDRGILPDLVPLLQRASDAAPLIAAYRAGLAIAFAEANQFDRANQELDRLFADGAHQVARDSQWPACLALAGEAAALVGHRAHAATAYDLLLPWSGQAVVIPNTVVVLGPADRPLGMLAEAVGLIDAAARHFEEATRIATSLRSPPWLGRTHVAHAAFLHRIGDAENARQLAQEALTIADAVGMPTVAAAATALLSARVE